MTRLESRPRSAERLFGTDGIRGPAGQAPLDRGSLIRIGRALGKLLKNGNSSPSAILAGDTRASTPDICAWLSQGLEESGCRTIFGGVLPTPAVSRLAKSRSATVGIAVSASHNPFPDNGVKLLDGAGFKWSREREIELERLVDREPDFVPEAPEPGTHPSSPEPLESLRRRYLDELLALFPDGALEGLPMVLDTANGAASGLAEEFFSALGAQVATLGDHPNGSNINLDCGSTRPELASSETVGQGAALGFAFDGDADRALAIDHLGTVHDGDAMLYVLAGWFHRERRLDPPRIVATSMSNLGLERALEKLGIGLIRCDVGDRAVVDTLLSEGLSLGGEQAGHIVHVGLSATGDGLLSAALLAQAVKESGTPLAELAAGFERFPQILRNIRVPAKPDFDSLPRVVARAAEVEKTLGASGRLVLRYSGTEPLARVMIEGPDQARIEELAEQLATTIAEEIEARK